MTSPLSVRLNDATIARLGKHAIDQWIEANAEEAIEAHAAWAAGKNAVAR